ncbi:bifunctional DNA-formamidopyrimidine glycosylase/DNA-(apurinic or apyrimidinic site) lyase [Ectothiorhodospiraceae bacterium WFHF3C12]|nr:bifunctional DNA-formamidopyrimidine glycosylase/DNA-(apurinic or apyrimidinic site) lyase [Ectothiorhodospiraceae bacterium WFHF3C12]
MPELPEVETTRLGIAPYLVGKRVARLEVRDPRLRWPVPAGLSDRVAGDTLSAVERRAKYLLLRLGRGTLLVHLGMSGSMRVLPAARTPERHAHWDMVMADGTCLRYTDPRRFGSLHWVEGAVERHPLLAQLGPEPFADTFDGGYLYRHSRGRRLAVKAFIMDSRVVVGVGNIYASEALFRAGIHPARAAGRVGRQRYAVLAEAVAAVLREAIEAGGTTLRDFTSSEGRPGYFRQQLSVYGRGGERCRRCTQGRINVIRLGQRATYYCPRCQR